MYKKGDIVKLTYGLEVIIINLTNSFMANGSYEVNVWPNKEPKSFWVKPEDILYKINPEFIDNINNYFEIIWDEGGLNMVPKNFLYTDIESDDGFNKIKLSFDDSRKHKTINIHVGDSVINDLNKITTRPKPKKGGKFKEIINVLKKEEEDEV